MNPACGTGAAYQRHLLRGEEVCEACQAAHAAYTRGRRADPDRYQLHKERCAARARATARLRHLHPDEYERLYVEEMGPPRRVTQEQDA